MRFHHRLAGMAGNILEHYDNALFGLLAPFIAPLFFDPSDPLTALILTYGMLPLGILMRPLGSLFFGWIGDQFGRSRALFCSLVGMAIATLSMGCLPTYADIGMLAPLFLALGRIVQNFCAAGESVGGAVFILEHTEKSRRSMMSAVYNASSIGGILLASFMVTFFDEYWRVLFWMGGGCGVIGVLLRLKTPEKVRATKMKLWSALKEHREMLAVVIILSGFSYTTYSLAFTFMNGYVPLVTNLSKTQVMGSNTVLLFVDMALLPLFGYLAAKVSEEKMMLRASLAAVCSAIPLFYFLKEANLAAVIIARVVILTLGVAFSATYHSWLQERVPAESRYTILSLGYAIGSQLIGAPAVSLSLWLYKKMGWAGSPALYLMAIAGAAAFVVRKYSVRIENKVDAVS